MWAHYADSNNGCCIECEVVSDPNSKVEEVSVAYVPYVEPVAHLDPLQYKQILSKSWNVGNTKMRYAFKTCT